MAGLDIGAGVDDEVSEDEEYFDPFGTIKLPDKSDPTRRESLVVALTTAEQVVS